MSDKPNGPKEDYVEVWADLIKIKDLVLSLFISSVTTLGGYLIAPDEPPKPLIFGLIGAIVGFVIASVIIKPKRTFKYVEEEQE
ncbi:hypothetical protein JNUCC1_02185 [Lentibacillus sp. JNUCC-1]|uniref:hypothetical protein n=1 Tax=Lentibacillus sp. JNUCC-1 TaxID=2654513 RepID=UPI0012E8173F|nr:hypothetical protein [Lentibacillus sp. JNUCC-1]MUV38347.1 hypothetical protein [Lentibacillus sp. JNUCC-1]